MEDRFDVVSADGRTVIAHHPAGHVVMFTYSADARNEVYVQSTHWVGDDVDTGRLLQQAAMVARLAARAKGWTY